MTAGPHPACIKAHASGQGGAPAVSKAAANHARAPPAATPQRPSPSPSQGAFQTRVASPWAGFQTCKRQLGPGARSFDNSPRSAGPRGPGHCGWAAGRGAPWAPEPPSGRGRWTSTSRCPSCVICPSSTSRTAPTARRSWISRWGGVPSLPRGLPGAPGAAAARSAAPRRRCCARHRRKPTAQHAACNGRPCRQSPAAVWCRRPRPSNPRRMQAPMQQQAVR